MAGKSWFVGESLTLADVSVFMSFVVPCQTIFGEEFRRTVPHFNNWFNKMASLPSVVARAGYIRATPVAIKIENNSPVFSAPQVAKPAASAAPAKKEEPAKKDEKADDDDDLDLFGDDDEEATKAAEEAKAKAAAQKKPKKVVI